jgi:hypothetical protein
MVDWEDAGWGPPVFEVGYLLLTCHLDRLQLPAVRADAGRIAVVATGLSPWAAVEPGGARLAARGRQLRRPLIEEAVRLRLEQPARSAAHIAEMLFARHGVPVPKRTLREQLQERGVTRIESDGRSP